MSDATVKIGGVDGDNWMQFLVDGWLLAEKGKWNEAYKSYSDADEIMKAYGYGCVVNPALQLLRHGVGEAKGTMFPMPPVEDQVVCIQWEDGEAESIDSHDMKSYDIDRAVMAGAIRQLVDREYDGPHKHNLKGEGIDIQVLSTGRCGTVSLYHLLEMSQYSPFHTFFYQIPRARRYEMASKILAGDVSDVEFVTQYWIRSRSAELRGCENVGRPMFNLNHMDTAFAPVMAAIRPQSKFIHLRRDPVKVFRSFYQKAQWSKNQIVPLVFRLDPFEFRFRRYDQQTALAWYIRWTEVFAEAMQDAVGDRMIQVSADRLFAGDEEEIQMMIEFCNLPMTVPEIQKHYRIPYNTKAHKIVTQSEAAEELFKYCYQEFGGEL